MFGKATKSTLCATLLLLLLTTTRTFAAGDEAPDLTFQQRSAALHMQLMQSVLEPEPVWANIEDDPFGDPKEEPEMYGFKRKSPRRAFFYSLLVPGAGQIYNGSHIIKPILFLGLEIVGIYSYINYHGKGVDKRGEYEVFADDHWFYDGFWEDDTTFQPGYIQSLEALHESADWRYGDTAKWHDPNRPGDPWVNDYSEHLDVRIDPVADSARPVRNHAYYENIGKYDQFQWGWDDTYFDEQDSNSAHRLAYLDMRAEANDEFGRASTALILTMVNHLASAFDAALSARRHNRQQDKLAGVSVKMRYVLYDGNPMPKLTLSYRY